MTRSAHITVRVKPTEREALIAIANQEELNLSATMRRIVREAAQKRGLWPLRGNGQGTTQQQNDGGKTRC